MSRPAKAGARTGRRGWVAVAGVLLLGAAGAARSACAAEAPRTVRLLPHASRVLTLAPAAEAPPSQPPVTPVAADTTPALPPDWSVRVTPSPAAGTGYVVRLTAGGEDTLFGPDPVAWTGRVHVRDAAGRSIASEKVIVRAGARLPPVGVIHSGVWWTLLGSVIVCAAIVAAGYSVLRSRRAQGNRTVPHARLVPADNRTRRITKPLDLRHIAHERRQLRLLLGTGRDADILVRHDDVQARHAWIAVVPDPERGPHLQLTPVEGARVRLNSREVTGPVALADGDLLVFGMVRFVFEMAELYRPIIVECRDGRRLEGFPAEWDATAPGFVFRPRDASATDPVQIVPYESIIAVHFVTDWDPELRKRLYGKPEYPAGEHVRLRLADGQELCGYLTPDYDPRMPRFHFLPEPVNGILMSIIERAALDTLVPLDA